MNPPTVTELFRKWLLKQLASDRTTTSAVIGAYQAQVTRFVCGANATWVQMLKADSRRVYVRFINNTNIAANRLLIPGPVPKSLTALGVSAIDLDYKFRDCPAVVTGEWYYYGGLNDQVVIIEELKIAG